MNQKDLRNIFSEIKYTEEFKAKMRQRLSEAPQNTEYSQSVEGVEHDRRSNIVRRFSAAAAACAVIAALGLAGYGMKNMLSDNDDVFTPTAAEATTLTSAEETTVPMTESPDSDRNAPLDMNAYQAEKEKQELEKAEIEKQKEAKEETEKNIQEAIDNQKEQEKAEAQIKALEEAMKNKEEKSTQAE